MHQQSLFISVIALKKFKLKKFNNVTFTSHARNDKFTLHFFGALMDEIIITGLAILGGIAVPLAAFYWQYMDAKNQRATIVEISKNLNDSEQIEDLLNIFDERKKEPLDYRRSGVVTLFVGIGLFLFGVYFLGFILKGVGALVTAIGIGQIIAGYLYPNTSEEITNAVDAFEKK